MSYPSNLPVTAFEGTLRIASGAIIDVIADVLRRLARAPDAIIQVFDDATGERIDLDWNIAEFHLVAQLEPPVYTPVEPVAPPKTPRRPGRPRLGVVAREVTLLPAHWSWLNSQPGGASAALRRLVDEVQRTQEIRERVRRAQEAAYRFIQLMAAELPGYDEALRALYGNDAYQFDASTMHWPEDIRNYARQLAFTYS